MRAEGMLGYKSAIPSASGVSAQLHSADPHLRRNKEKSLGSSRYEGAIQGHQTRGESPHRSPPSRPPLKLFSAPALPVPSHCLLITQERV